MTAFQNASRYRSVYDDEDDEQDDVHPSIERQAQRIVHRSRMRMITKWWISSIGIVVIISACLAPALISMSQISYAGMACLASALGTSYLVHRSLLSLR